MSQHSLQQTLTAITDTAIHIVERYSRVTLTSALKKRYWSIGFSGGKDSSVLLDIALRLLEEKCTGNTDCPEKVVIVYSDTLLEPPPIRDYALGVIEALNRLAREKALPVHALAASPAETGEDIVEMVLIRGYPAPSTHFRWCTDRWKIRPTRQALRRILGSWKPSELAVITGIRAEEAAHRGAKLACSCTLAASDDVGGEAYAPLLPWKTSHIWSYIDTREPAWGQPSWKILHSIYGSSKNELRMGCWACTLIARDHGWENLAERGLVSSRAYRLLNLWKQLWLHMSRGRPDIWRQKKTTTQTKTGRKWRFHYSKLKPEARYILAEALLSIAECPDAEEIVAPIIENTRTALKLLAEYSSKASQLLSDDPYASKILYLIKRECK